MNRDGGSLLSDCIESVMRYSRNFELILVDNASSDGSELVVARKFPNVSIVRLDKNLGFSRAINVGVARSKGKFIVLLNPDTVVTPHWLNALLQCIVSSKTTGIAVPKLLKPDRVTVDAAGHYLQFETAYTVIRGAGEPDYGQYDDSIEVPSCCFACALIRREVFRDIGLLDEKMFLYYEDVDFCLRARIGGWAIIYCPKSIVYHHRGGLTPPSARVTQLNAVAYRLRIILKCYSLSNMMRCGIGRVLRDSVSALAGIKNRDVFYSLGYAKSPLWNLVNLPVRERIQVQSRRKVPDSEIVRIAGAAARLSFKT